MKNKFSRLRFTSPFVALALTAGAAHAGTEAVAPAVATPDWLAVSGYANATYAYSDAKAGGHTESFADSGANNLDSIKVGFTATQGPVQAYASLFYVPNAADEAGILDAYLTYTAGSVSVTAGKYLSYLGYEAFDAINMSQITYANGIGAIPAYHSGVKLDFKSDMFDAGVSVADSERGGAGFFRGDDGFTDDLGFEAYVSYKGIQDLTVWLGAGYEDTKGETPTFETYDLWASYKVTDKLTVAAEAAYNAGGVNSDPFIDGATLTTDGMQYLAFASYAFTDKFSLVGRVGLDDIQTDGFNTVVRYTVAPSYSINEHLIVRAEATYSDTSGDSTTNNMFYGVQGLLKF